MGRGARREREGRVKRWEARNTTSGRVVWVRAQRWVEDGGGEERWRLWRRSRRRRRDISPSPVTRLYALTGMRRARRLPFLPPPPEPPVPPLTHRQRRGRRRRHVRPDAPPDTPDARSLFVISPTAAGVVPRAGAPTGRARPASYGFSSCLVTTGRGDRWSPAVGTLPSNGIRCQRGTTGRPRGRVRWGQRSGRGPSTPHGRER